MKKDLHPSNYRDVVFKDMSNGETFITRSTVASKETIELDAIGNVGVERREKSYHVTYLIKRHSVEKEEIIGAIASTNIKSAGKLRSARHTR